MTYDFAVLRDKWSLQIGRFMVAFGGIEQVIHAALNALPHDPIGQAATQMFLGPRIDLLLAVLNGRHGKDWRNFAALLKKAKRLAEERNLIAHNPLGLEYYKNAEGQHVAGEQTIRSLRNQ
jgi:hypothetical protein